MLAASPAPREGGGRRRRQCAVCASHSGMLVVDGSTGPQYAGSGAAEEPVTSGSEAESSTRRWRGAARSGRGPERMTSGGHAHPRAASGHLCRATAHRCPCHRFPTRHLPRRPVLTPSPGPHRVRGQERTHHMARAARPARPPPAFRQLHPGPPRRRVHSGARRRASMVARIRAALQQLCRSIRRRAFSARHAAFPWPRWPSQPRRRRRGPRRAGQPTPRPGVPRSRHPRPGSRRSATTWSTLIPFLASGACVLRPHCSGAWG